MMEYKGYLGTVEYDEQAKIFHGDIINTRDVIDERSERRGRAWTDMAERVRKRRDTLHYISGDDSQRN